MFDKTDFAAALLVLSAVVLPGCGSGESGSFQADATVPAAPGDTPVARVIKHPDVGVTLSHDMIDLEPDFFGFARGYGLLDQVPAQVTAANPTDCADQANTVAGLAHCLIAMTRK
ncbi:hypothetical protein NWF24_02960 [Variovorax paradoxus]|uniref:hypothetical protein n=1 Tax=Variovorax paradoxus TaxID=34073 RepID=UPI0021ACEDB8|nr:hypothetical protein [Variovorax paradoxus]UVH58388.1 hypothetical protein NWF24_02960 [Variovorax paradoxus]